MGVYNKSGEKISSAFNRNGNTLNAVYSVDGAKIFPPLKIMTYNVGGWYDGSGQNVPASKDQEYFNLQYGTIADNDPDILFINEYWDVFSKTGRTAVSFLSELFPYVYPVNGTAQYLGRCICSKYPLSNYTQRIFTGLSPDDRYYDTIIANIDGKDVTLCIAFFGWKTIEERKAEADVLIPFLQSLETPFICAGDLNTAKTSLISGNEDYVNIIKPMLDAGFKLANFGDFGKIYTFKDTVGSGGRGALDHIVFSPDFTIESAIVDERKLNDQLTETADHMPLIAEAIMR